MSAPILTLDHISKRFGATQALDDVGLTLYPGEVHALLGENGAGKSTLIKIMTGIHRPDRGEMRLAGEPISVSNPAEAQARGIAAIYQEPAVFPDLNVAENIFITHANRGVWRRWGRVYREAEAVLARLGVRLDVRAPARGLTVAAQQTIEIAKALSLNIRVLIMDEPTAALSAHEADQLFDIVRTLRDEGVAILFVSHRLEEVFGLANRVTVLRDGRFVSSQTAAETSPQQAIRDMVGREMADFYAKTGAERGDVLLALRDLSRTGAFESINFDVHAGEVVGMAGLVGARRTDVALAIFGIAPADGGEIWFDGASRSIRSPQQALDLGIAYLSEDRRALGLTMPMSIATNITLPKLGEYLAALGLIQRSREAASAERYRKRLAVRTPSVHAPVSSLSGGNQQKVMLGKWLNTQPKLLILDEPTRGIDIGAKREVHQIIDELAQQGLGILLISSDLPEVLAMSDRIVVMREGRQMGVFDGDASQELIMTAATGQGSN